MNSNQESFCCPVCSKPYARRSDAEGCHFLSVVKQGHICTGCGRVYTGGGSGLEAFRCCHSVTAQEHQPNSVPAKNSTITLAGVSA